MSDIVDCKRKVNSKKKCLPRKVFGDEGASNEEWEQEEANKEMKKLKSRRYNLGKGKLKEREREWEEEAKVQ